MVFAQCLLDGLAVEESQNFLPILLTLHGLKSSLPYAGASRQAVEKFPHAILNTLSSGHPGNYLERAGKRHYAMKVQRL